MACGRSQPGESEREVSAAAAAAGETSERATLRDEAQAVYSPQAVTHILIIKLLPLGNDTSVEG